SPMATLPASTPASTTTKAPTNTGSCAPSSWCQVNFGTHDQGNIHESVILYNWYDTSGQPTQKYYTFGYVGTLDGSPVNRNAHVKIVYNGGVNNTQTDLYISQASATFNGSPILNGEGGVSGDTYVDDVPGEAVC